MNFHYSNQGSFCPPQAQDSTNIPLNSLNLPYSYFPNQQIPHIWDLFLTWRQNNINHGHFSTQTEPNNLCYQQAQPPSYYHQNCQTLWGDYSLTPNPHSFDYVNNSPSSCQQPAQEQKVSQDYLSETTPENYQSNHFGPNSEYSEEETEVQENYKNSKIDQRNVYKANKSKQPFDWNEKQDQILLERVQKYKKDWKKVENYFKRNVAKLTIHALKNRYRVLLGNPYQLRVKFTHKEDLEIALYFSRFGRDWDRVAEYFPKRNKQMIKNRYYSFIKKKSNYDRLLGELKQSALKNDLYETMDYQNNESTSTFLGESPRSEGKIKVFPELTQNLEIWNPNLNGQLSHKIAPFEDI